jgi:hypothetical protein
MKKCSRSIARSITWSKPGAARAESWESGEHGPADQEERKKSQWSARHFNLFHSTMMRYYDA